MKEFVVVKTQDYPEYKIYNSKDLAVANWRATVFRDGQEWVIQLWVFRDFKTKQPASPWNGMWQRVMAFPRGTKRSVMLEAALTCLRLGMDTGE